MATEAESKVSDGSESSDENAYSSSMLLQGVESFSKGTESSRKRKHEAIYLSESGLNSKKIDLKDFGSLATDPSLQSFLPNLPISDAADSSTRDVRQKLSAPLSKLHQDRFNREAAYDKTKVTLNRWLDTTRQMREAEQVAFPISKHNSNVLNEVSFAKSSKNEVVVTEAQKDLESKVARSLVGSASTSERELVKSEVFGTRKNDEHAQIGIAQLRMARELLFREEIRARRVKKIKSKSYRRILKREREKLVKAMEDKYELGLEGETLSDDAEKMRAEERMSLRHKDSRWGRKLRGSGRLLWDLEAKNDAIEMARQYKTVTKQITSQDDSIGTEDSLQDGRDVNTESVLRDVASPPQSRLLRMKFMEAAEIRQRPKGDSYEYDQPTEKIGKRIFHDSFTKSSSLQGTSGASAGPLIPLISEGKSSRNDVNRSDKPLGELSLSSKGNANPWLLKSGLGADRKIDLLEPEGGPEALDVRVNISATNLIPPNADAIGEVNRSGFGNNGNESANNSNILPRPKTDLVGRAFAGDNVLGALMKEAEVQHTDELTLPKTNLPGWGAWVGSEPYKRRTNHLEKSSVALQLSKSPSISSSYNNKVIISNKRAKRNLKYMATNVPFPFESREQYEQSLRCPIGQEWSTKRTHQNLTAPRVIVENGRVITPLSKPL